MHCSFTGSESWHMKTAGKLGSLFVALASLVVLPACWTFSLQPLAEAGDPQVIYDPALEGRWPSDPNDGCALVIRGKAKDRDYTLQFLDLPGHKHACRDQPGRAGLGFDGPRFSGQLIQLGGASFLDAVPTTNQGFGYIPGHSIFKLESDSEGFFLINADGGWLCQDATALKLGTCMDGQIFLFTATTETLQDFVKKHADDEKVFPKPGPGTAFRFGRPRVSK